MKQHIFTGLKEIGTCFAGSTEKYVAAGEGDDAKPTYHIHPGAKTPHEASVLCFSSLKEIEAYIAARRRADAVYDPHDASRSIDIMDAFWATHS